MLNDFQGEMALNKVSLHLKCHKIYLNPWPKSYVSQVVISSKVGGYTQVNQWHSTDT